MSAKIICYYCGWDLLFFSLIESEILQISNVASFIFEVVLYSLLHFALLVKLVYSNGRFVRSHLSNIIIIIMYSCNFFVSFNLHKCALLLHGDFNAYIIKMIQT